MGEIIVSGGRVSRQAALRDGQEKTRDSRRQKKNRDIKEGKRKEWWGGSLQRDYSKENVR